jgi:hypothetical protein
MMIGVNARIVGHLLPHWQGPFSVLIEHDHWGQHHSQLQAERTRRKKSLCVLWCLTFQLYSVYALTCVFAVKVFFLP